MIKQNKTKQQSEANRKFTHQALRPGQRRKEIFVTQRNPWLWTIPQLIQRDTDGTNESTWLLQAELKPALAGCCGGANRPFQGNQQGPGWCSLQHTGYPSTPASQPFLARDIRSDGLIPFSLAAIKTNGVSFHSCPQRGQRGFDLSYM